MKQVLIVSGVLLTSLTVSAAPAVAGKDMSSMPMPAKSATTAVDTATVLTDATVKRVDAASGMVMLQHGAMANIGMPAMTMAYKAKDTAMARSIQSGDKVHVRVENLGGTLTIVRMDK